MTDLKSTLNLCLQYVAAFLILAILFLSAAKAHSHNEAWAYDPECCSSQDCAPVPSNAITEVNGGYQIIIAPGSHPMVELHESAVVLFIPHGDPKIRVSGDGLKHACVGRITKTVFCVYVPTGGV